MFLKTILSALLVGVLFVAEAQNLESSIPTNATVVGFINAENYKSKGDFSKILELDFVKEFDNDFRKKSKEHYNVLSKIYKSPKEVGINLFPKSYGFWVNQDSVQVVGFLFELSDSEKFKNLAEKHIYSAEKQFYMEDKGTYKYITDPNNFGVAWSGKMGVVLAVIGDGNLYENLDYNAPDYEEKMNAKQQTLKANKQAVFKKHLENVFAQKGNIMQNANFQTFINEKVDGGVWINYANVLGAGQRYPKELERLGLGSLSFIEKLKPWLKDQYDHYLLNSSKGEATIQLKSYQSEKLSGLLSGAFDKKINPDFFKYIDGTKMLGFQTFAADSKKVMAAYWEMYKDVLGDTPKYGKGIAAGMDWISIMLDEDAIFSTFKGDFMMAITDVKELDIPYTEAEYDGDYYVGESKKIRKEKIPIFIGLGTIGNMSNFQKLVDISESFDGLKSNGNYYEMYPRGNGMKVYLAIQNNIVIVSNDENLIKQKLMQGVAASSRVNDATQKIATQNGLMFYMNTKNILDATLRNEKDLDKEDLAMIADIQKNIGDFKVVGIESSGRMLKVTATLDVKNTKDNSIFALAKVMNTVYRFDEIKRKKRYAKYEKEEKSTKKKAPIVEEKTVSPEMKEEKLDEPKKKDH